MISWVRTSFVIQSEEIKTHDITKLLGTKPTRFVEKGDVIAKGSPTAQIHVRDISAWTLESGLDDTEDLDKHLDILIQFIEDKKSELYELSKICSLRIQVGCSFTDQGVIWLDSNILKRLSNLPINLMISLYD